MSSNIMTISGRIIVSGPVTELPVTSDPVFKLEGDTGLIGGATITSWTDSVGGLVLAPNGASPSAGTLDSGATGVLFTGTNEGLVKLDGVGNLPVGNASRTVFVCVRYDASFYSGFGWGTNVAGEAFTVGVDAGFTPCVDFFGGSRLLGLDDDDHPIQTIGVMVLISADHNAATNETRLFINDVLVESRTQAINTGASRINLLETFSNASVAGHVGAVYVFDTVLSDAERHNTSQYLIEKYIRDVTPPIISADSILSTGATTASATVTTNEVCNVWWGIKTGATPPTVANLKTGVGFVAGAFGTTFNGADAALISASGLTPAQTYYLFTYAEDIATPPNASAIKVSLGVATLASSSAPVVTIGTPVPTSTGGTFPWSTTQGNGNARLLVSANTVESVATIKATGTSIAVTASGAQPPYIIGNLAPSQPRTLHIVHTNIDGLDSAIAKVNFTTLAEVGGSSWTEHDVATTAGQVRTKISDWANNTNLPAGKTFADEKILALTASVTGNIDLTNINNTGGRIWLRCKGTYNGLSGCSVKVNGMIDISNSRKLGFTRMHVIGPSPKVSDDQGGTFSLYQTHDVIISRNWLTGFPGVTESVSTDGPGESNEPSDPGPLWSFNNIYMKHYFSNIIVADNFLEVAGEGGLITVAPLAPALTHGPDVTIRGNVFGYFGHDCMKVTQSGRLQILDNWFSRSMTGDASHVDIVQFWANAPTHYHDNNLYQGNVHLSGSGSAWFASGGVSNRQKSHMSFWTDSVTRGFQRNCAFKENIIANGQRIYGDAETTNTPTTGNLFMLAGVMISGGTVRGNYDWNFYNGSQGTEADYGAGPNGVPSRNNMFANPINLSGLLTHWNTVPMWDGPTNGPWTIPNIPHSIEKFLPKTTSRLHWNHVNPLPIAFIFKRWFDTTYRYNEETTSGKIRVPGDLGWPVAYHWQRYYNRNNAVTTRFSPYHNVGTSGTGVTHGIGAGGVYNADGDIVPA